MDISNQINEHYGSDSLSKKILEALKDSGKDASVFSLDDLASMEEFHIGGRKATFHLANLAGLDRGMKVLDIGCGIGGPARALANSFGCNVIGVDLTKEFCFAGAMLTQRANLADKIIMINGSAGRLPFESGICCLPF